MWKLGNKKNLFCCAASLVKRVLYDQLVHQLPVTEETKPEPDLCLELDRY